MFLAGKSSSFSFALGESMMSTLFVCGRLEGRGRSTVPEIIPEIVPVSPAAGVPGNSLGFM